MESTLTFGPWAPDYPAFGGSQLNGGGVVLCFDAKGVYPTLGGYRPLVRPGTVIGAFTNSDFAELYTPNTMPSSALADIWLDDTDVQTLTLNSPTGGSTWIAGWDNKITGATNDGQSIPSIGYFSQPRYLNVSVYQSGEPESFGAYFIATSGQAALVDVDFSASHTAATLWAIAITYHRSTASTSGVLMQFCNADEDAVTNGDAASVEIEAAGTVSLVRDGETSVDGAAFTQESDFITFVGFDGAEKFIRTNGVEIDRNASVAAFDITKVRIGAHGAVVASGGIAGGGPYRNWFGAIREVVVGLGPIAEADIQKLEGWLAHKRNRTALLPANHPYKTDAPQTAASTSGANEPTSHFLSWSRAGAPYFFVGDYDKLWLLNQAGQSFDDVSNASTAYLASRDLPWQFAQFGNRVIAVTKNTPPQYYDLGTSATFADLPGTPPNARAVAQVRDFIFLGSLTESGVKYESRVRWSGFNDSEDWTTDPGGTQADFQDLDAQYGEVTAIVGGEYATVFQQRAISRFTYVGGAAIWQRDTVEINRGAIAPLSVIQVGRLIYYYSHDGFWAFDGAASQRISGDQINRWVKNRLSDDTAQKMRVEHDPDRRIIMWAWPYDPDGLSRATSGLQLIFNYESGQWSYNIDTDLRWWIVRGPPVQDYIDLDSDPIDDDAGVIDSEATSFGRTLSLNYDGELWRLSALDGGDVTGRLETAKIALSPGYRSFVTTGRVVGNIDASSTIWVSVAGNAAYPEKTLASESSATEYTHYSVNDGHFPVRAEGRYHGISVRWDGGRGTTTGDLEELAVIQGIHVEFQQRGKR